MWVSYSLPKALYRHTRYRDLGIAVSKSDMDTHILLLGMASIIVSKNTIVLSH